MKEKTSALRAYLQELTTKEMSAEQLEKHNQMLALFDEIDKEDEANVKEIQDCKNIIVSNIKSQGSAAAPQEEKKPRSLEEIAKDMLNNGGK